MKKLFFLALLITFSLFRAPLVQGQSFGYNIVNNFFDENGQFNDAAFVALNGQAATVRITSADVAGHPELIGQIEQAARDNHITLIWQPEDWEATTPAQFMERWSGPLSQITMGTISLFTEYNYHYGNPEQYAQILQTALNSSFANRVAFTNLNITNPSGVISPFGQVTVEYHEFLQQVEANCHCLNQIPVWSVSIYGRGSDVAAAVDDFVGQLNGFVSSLGSLGVNLNGKQLVIPEVGLDPSVPIGQRLAMAVNFATQLETRIHDDEALRKMFQENGLVLSSLTFLIMDDKTGKQYFLHKDKDGNWVLEEYGGILSGSGPEFCDYGVATKKMTIKGNSPRHAAERAAEIVLENAHLANYRPMVEILRASYNWLRPPQKDKETPPLVPTCTTYIEIFYCDGDQLKRLGDEGEVIEKGTAPYASLGSWVVEKMAGITVANPRKISLLTGIDNGRVPLAQVINQSSSILGESTTLVCGQPGSTAVSMESEPTYSQGKITVIPSLGQIVRQLIERAEEKVWELIFQPKEYTIYAVNHSPNSGKTAEKQEYEVKIPLTLPGDKVELKDAEISGTYGGGVVVDGESDKDANKGVFKINDKDDKFKILLRPKEQGT